MFDFLHQLPSNFVRLSFRAVQVAHAHLRWACLAHGKCCGCHSHTERWAGESTQMAAEDIPPLSLFTLAFLYVLSGIRDLWPLPSSLFVARDGCNERSKACRTLRVDLSSPSSPPAFTLQFFPCGAAVRRDAVLTSLRPVTYLIKHERA